MEYVTIEDVVELDDAELMQEYLKINEQMSALKKRKDEITALMKEKIGDYSYGMTEYGVATWKYINSKPTLDTKRLEQEHPEIYEQYLKETTPTRRFTVKPMQE